MLRILTLLNLVIGLVLLALGLLLVFQVVRPTSIGEDADSLLFLSSFFSLLASAGFYTRKRGFAIVAAIPWMWMLLAVASFLAVVAMWPGGKNQGVFACISISALGLLVLQIAGIIAAFKISKRPPSTNQL
jgi:hypothetical protein